MRAVWLVGMDLEGEERRIRKKGKKKEKEQWGDKMRLRSEVVPNATGYYSGIVQDGALHLHPVSKLLQFRTSLNYLDDYDERRHRASKDKEGTAEGSDRKPKVNGVGPAGMPGRPVRKLIEEDNDGSGSIKDFREKMWTMAREETEDPWVSYAWKSGEAESAVDNAIASMVVPPDKRDRLECATRPLDYLNRE